MGGGRSGRARADNAPVGRHVVGSLHTPHRAHVLVGTAVAHHTDGFDREEHHKGLTDQTVLPVFVELLDLFKGESPGDGGSGKRVRWPDDGTEERASPVPMQHPTPHLTTRPTTFVCSP